MTSKSVTYLLTPLIDIIRSCSCLIENIMYFLYDIVYRKHINTDKTAVVIGSIETDSIVQEVVKTLLTRFSSVIVIDFLNDVSASSDNTDSVSISTSHIANGDKNMYIVKNRLITQTDVEYVICELKTLCKNADDSIYLVVVKLPTGMNTTQVDNADMIHTFACQLSSTTLISNLNSRIVVLERSNMVNKLLKRIDDETDNKTVIKSIKPIKPIISTTKLYLDRIDDIKQDSEFDEHVITNTVSVFKDDYTHLPDFISRKRASEVAKAVINCVDYNLETYHTEPWMVRYFVDIFC